VRFALKLYERFRMLIHEAAKFGAVGLVGFVVSLGGADVLHFDAGVGKYKAVVVATIAATIVTFVGNRYWAFRHRERVGMGRETVLFFVFNAIGLAIQLACVAIVQDGAGLQVELQPFCPVRAQARHDLVVRLVNLEVRELARPRHQRLHSRPQRAEAIQPHDARERRPEPGIVGVPQDSRHVPGQEAGFTSLQ